MRKTFCVLVCDVRVLLCFSSSSRFVCVLWLKNPFSKRRGGKTGFFLALSFFFREREREIPRERRLEIGDLFFFAFKYFSRASICSSSIRSSKNQSELFFFLVLSTPQPETHKETGKQTTKKGAAAAALYLFVASVDCCCCSCCFCCLSLILRLLARV